LLHEPYIHSSIKYHWNEQIAFVREAFRCTGRQK